MAVLLSSMYVYTNNMFFFWACSFTQVTWDQTTHTCASEYEISHTAGTASQATCEQLCADTSTCKFYFRNTANGWCGLYEDCANKRQTPENAGFTYECNADTGIFHCK